MGNCPVDPEALASRRLDDIAVLAGEVTQIQPSPQVPLLQNERRSLAPEMGERGYLLLSLPLGEGWGEGIN